MKIIILGRKGASTRFIYNGIKSEFKVSKLIIEDGIPRRRLIRNRIKKLGFFKVGNQLLFQFLIPKLLLVNSKERIENLKIKYSLNDITIPKEKIINVKSVNSDHCYETLKKINPDIVIVNGTRIISKRILSVTSALFINTHAGITPEYRGVHGAYWALVNDDLENCGVTIHKVDSGIDTGSILKQATINPNKEDNFVTYPFHQYGVGISLLKEVLNQIISGKLKTYRKKDVVSKLYYHPTLSSYLYNFIFRDIR